MNLKTGVTTILLSSVYFLSGCSEQSIEADIYKNEEVSNTVNSIQLVKQGFPFLNEL